MKKKRTLNQTWILCLRMWRWISKKWSEEDSVEDLKTEWLKLNGFSRINIPSGCFFCNYTNNCSQCPGRLVDSNFQCSNLEYHYEKKPIAFYQKLLRLNRIRKGIN